MKIFKSILVVLAMLFLLAGCFERDLQNDNTNNENTNNVSDTNFSLGEYDGNTYTNTFLDIKLTIPEDWEYYTEEEIADMMDLGAELAYGEDSYKAKVADLTSAYYAVASNRSTGENVSIISEKPLVDVTMDNYISQLQEQLKGIESVNYEIGETSTAKLGDLEYTTLAVTAPDYNIFQKYFVRKVDKYFVGIIATSQTEENINQIMTFFE